MTFEEFGFEERIQKGIDEAGFKAPMPVQAECFELLIRSHRDIYAQSQTGTGKTAAFLLGIFQLVTAEEEYRGEKALIIVPTRELAIQIEREGKALAKYLDLHIGSVFGGVGYRGQERMLEEGVDILVGTPGRLIDFDKQNKISFKDFRFLVIDEADRLFDMGFLPDLRKILRGMRPYSERHTMLFSATLNPRVGNLAWEHMNDPGEVIIEPEKVTVDTVTQELYHVGKDEKMQLLLGILKRDDPENAVVFTNTRQSAWEVAKRMEINGYAVSYLIGDLPQLQRIKIIDEVKKGHHKFLVATDVAARGLHIDELEMVVNYDVPLEAESYVHRIGRTARAGNTGKTVTMACEEYVYGLNPVEKLLGEKIPVSWADESLLLEDKSAGMKFRLQDRFREIGRDDRSRDRERPGDGRRGGEASRKRGKTPRLGKKPLDPRAARIQSAVSSVVGSSGQRPAENQKKTPRPAAGRPGRDRPAQRRSETQPENQQARGKSESKPVAKKGATPAKKPPVKTERPQTKAESSVEDRLEYYRKKYGEDFRHPGSSSGAKPGAKKSRRRAAGSSSPEGAGQKQRPNQKKASGHRRDASRKPASKPSPKPQPAAETKEAPKKKGMISRLFGKK